MKVSPELLSQMQDEADGPKAATPPPMGDDQKTAVMKLTPDLLEQMGRVDDETEPAVPPPPGFR